MTSNAHKKHAHLTKPLGGKFHRTELGMIGAPCGVIQSLAKSVADRLADRKVGYVDADHGEGAEKPIYHRAYTDKITSHEQRYADAHITVGFREMFDPCDLVLVNANHFQAQKQIVLIHPSKKESLHRKLDRLTDVAFFILAEGEDGLFDFLLAHDPRLSDKPIVKLSETNRIAELIDEVYRQDIPIISGLVLAGGQSLRMGQDKGLIDYHGKPQREHTADLLAKSCPSTFLSLLEEDEESAYPTILDSFVGLGPFGGIISAFRSNPNVAWLTVATDIPLLDESTLDTLISHRNPSKLATCFHNPATGFPEPLITLWEPRAYRRLLTFMAQGHSCPRKVLINSEIEEIYLDDTGVLANANTPEEMAALRAKVKR